MSVIAERGHKSAGIDTVRSGRGWRGGDGAEALIGVGRSISRAR